MECVWSIDYIVKQPVGPLMSNTAVHQVGGKRNHALTTLAAAVRQNADHPG